MFVLLSLLLDNVPMSVVLYENSILVGFVLGEATLIPVVVCGIASVRNCRQVAVGSSYRFLCKR